MEVLSGNIILLTFLYFIQGLPYGFQVQFLPIYLRSKGVDLSHVGFMKLLHMPWLCKPLWAPLVDKLGTKRLWLIGSVIGLFATCLIGGLIPPDNLVLLCSILFLLNTFASTQDIAVDSVAVALLSEKELGYGNTAQVVGYKIGSIFGGGLLVWFMNFLGWTGLFLVLSVLYLEALMFVYVSPVLRDFEYMQCSGDYQNFGQVDNNSDMESDNFPDDCGSQFSDVSETLPDLIGQQSGYGSMERQRTGIDKPDLLSDNIDLIKETEADDLVNLGDQSPVLGDLINNTDFTSCDLDEKIFCKDKEDQHASVWTDGLCHSSSHDKLTRKYSSQGKEQLNECESEKSFDGEEITEEEIDSLQSAAEYVHKEKDEEEQISTIDFTDEIWTIVRVVLQTPGTKWMFLYLLLYKLGEQGALSMLPLFLVDQKVEPSDVTFWTGLVGQGVSIGGSVLGGFVVAKYRIPVHLFLQQLSLLRLTPLGIQVLLIGAWTMNIFIVDKYIYIGVAISSMFFLLLISGIVTTVTFTFMMQCSKMAPVSVQATHYSTLATCEVFGKLTFSVFTGWLTEILGYPAVFLVFVILGGVVLVIVDRCPAELRSSSVVETDDILHDSGKTKMD